MPISAARAAAFEILMRVETTDAYAAELLHAEKFAKLSAADHGLLTELVMGVLRWRGALDEEIAQHVRQPLAKFDVEVLSALRLGAYQLLFLDRIPAHAAINESVELVKKARKTSASGMVNAVLRKIAAHPVARSATKVEHPSIYSSHPRWLVERWEKNYGSESALRICEYDQTQPHTRLRLPASARNAAPDQAFDLSGIELAPGRLLAGAAVVTAGDITRTPDFSARQFAIQDEASQLVALLVGKGKRILDCCAAPGGKARILAEENPDAIVIGTEIHPHRADLLRKLVNAPNIRILAADARVMPFGSEFDRILVDAPCSGAGTLARNPEIKWRLKPEDLLRLQEYQVEILQAAMRQVAPGGQIVYSTCSLEPEENEQVIEKALAGKAGFRVLDAGERLMELQRSGELVWKNIDSLLSGPYLRTVPGVHPCDGFFAAILEHEQ